MSIMRAIARYWFIALLLAIVVGFQLVTGLVVVKGAEFHSGNGEARGVSLASLFFASPTPVMVVSTSIPTSTPQPTVTPTFTPSQQ